MKIILTESFDKRSQLDDFIRTRIGEEQGKNISHELEVSPDEAEKLGIGNSVKIYGVKVKVKI